MSTRHLMGSVASIKSRRGSTIAEAAVVMPFVILSVITVVLIIMFFYSQISQQCSMHTALRAEAGNVTGKTMILHDVSSDAELYTRKKAFGGVVSGKQYVIMGNKLLLHKKGACLVDDHAYAADGAEYVRYCRLIKSVGEDETDEDE